MERGLDTLRDPNAPAPAKIGAVAIVALGAIVAVTTMAIGAMNKK